MALGGEIVDLGGADLLHQPDQVGRVRHVAIVQQERHIAGVRILVEMIDARGVEGGRAPLHAMHGVAEPEQIFGKVSAILSGNAGQQRHAPFGILNRHKYSNNAPATPWKPANDARLPLSAGPPAGLAIAFDPGEV